jgi:hypothetical protein
MKNFAACVVAVLSVLCFSVPSADAQYAFDTLLDEMTDRDQLAKFPSSFSLLQASSHDTSATTLGGPDNFANNDFSKFLGTTTVNGRTEYILMQDTGAGAITRWWMTSSEDGTVRVYVDGNTTPVIAGGFKTTLAQNRAFGPKLAFRSLDYVMAGYDLYAPIPYSRSIKITYEGNPGTNATYYNINYRKYAAGTPVTSYAASNPTTYASQIAATNEKLSKPVAAGNISTKHPKSATLAAGQATVCDLGGTGAVRQIKLTANGADQAAALRDTYLELTFDGQCTARVPVGQFFGNGDGSSSKPYNAFEDFYRTVASDGTMTSRWVMPYQKAAQIRLVNNGRQNVIVSMQVDSGTWTWDSSSMYFHANIREEARIKTRGGNGTADFRAVTVRGPGVYVGSTLSLRNYSTQWWGEGDEKIYVDYMNADGVGSNAKPVIAGTGSEDYFGYAYAHPNTFTDTPFIAQPMGDGNYRLAGRTVNSRVHALDAVPFNRSFKFDMEVWHSSESQVDYGMITYWYGKPGTAAMRTVADLATDYRPNHNFTTQGGLQRMVGDGQWTYLSSSKANPSTTDAKTAPLSYGSVGDAGNDGYGGGQNKLNLAAISDRFISVAGSNNIGVQGGPGYHELALHPAGTESNMQNPFYGNAAMPFVVARWTAGTSSAGLANINGSIRNLIGGHDSVDFYIYVNGKLKFSAAASGATLPEAYFDIDVQLAKDSVIDFVLGNKGGGDFYGDESLLRANIFVEDTCAVQPKQDRVVRMSP